MKKISLFLWISIYWAMSGSAVLAQSTSAIVNNIKGAIMINTGESYLPARNGLRLKNGDQLMVLEGGSATIIQNNGCKTHLAENSLIVIKDLSKCMTQAMSIKAHGPAYAAALGAIETDAQSSDTKSPNDAEVSPEGGALGAFVVEEEVAETTVATEKPSVLASLGPTIAVPVALTGAVLFSTLAGGGGETSSTNTTPLSVQ